METKTENLWELRLDLRCGGRTWDMPRREESRRICIFRDDGVVIPTGVPLWDELWSTDLADGHDDDLDAFATAVEAELDARMKVLLSALLPRSWLCEGARFRKETAAADPIADDWECYWHKAIPVLRRHQMWEAEAWLSVYPANPQTPPPTII